MRTLFMGTGEIALPSFRMMVERGGLAGLVTQPDRPVGRSSRLRPPRIKTAAGDLGVKVVQPEKIGSKEGLDEVAALEPDLIVVMAYGQILPRTLLELPRYGCINVHASLLPRHRGASCIQAAIAAGDSESGVSIIYMTEELDAGDIIMKVAIPLDHEETGETLHDRLAELAPAVLSESMNCIASGEVSRNPQNESLATYARRLHRGDGELNWAHSSKDLECRIRAHDPWPGSFTSFHDARGRVKRLKMFPGGTVMEEIGNVSPGEIIRVSSSGITVACGTGAMRFHEVQVEGGNRLPVAEFIKGNLLLAGDCFFSLASPGE
ncbi:MAG: methionyl-tRNA formyltransferase [Roseibacillus sp.]|nr:methionyl-tRNA formyltransferase [Roseibacillus sp.]